VRCSGDAGAGPARVPARERGLLVLDDLPRYDLIDDVEDAALVPLPTPRDSNVRSPV